MDDNTVDRLYELILLSHTYELSEDVIRHTIEEILLLRHADIFIDK